MPGPETTEYNPDYARFLTVVEEYYPSVNLIDSVADRVSDLLETYDGGGAYGAFQHISNGEKLIILFLRNVRVELNSDTPEEIDGFKVLPGDWIHAPY